MVFSLFCEAVFTCKIAVVGNVKAECLHNRLPLLYFINKIFIYIPGKQAAFFRQGNDCLENVLDIFLSVTAAQLLFQISCSFRLSQCLGRMEFILLLKHADHIICCLVHHMDCTAVYIENDVISIVLIQMYHKSTSLSFFLKHFSRTCPFPDRADMHKAAAF